MPQQPIAEQLKDFVGKKPVQYTRQELPPHLFDCLSEDDPALCVSGDLMDLVSEQDGQKTVLNTLHQEALKRKYDIVLQYDPATNKITLVEELLGAGNSHRTKLEEVDLKVLDVNGNNLVPVMLEQSTIIPAHGFSPDRTALEIFKQAQRLGLKICLFINNADIFFGCTSDKFGGSISAPERPLNPRIITDFISYLRGTEGCHLIFADPKGKVTGEMQNEMPFHHVPLTTSEEIRGLLGKVIDLNQHPGAIPLAAGTSLRELQKRIKNLNGASANEVIGLLKKFKEDQIVALAGGAVKCSLDHYDDDMVAMPDAEKAFWTELAQILEVGGEELPQGCILVGPPGTGKSVRARYMASAMGVPFLELRDISSSGLRGLKEDKLRAALEAAIRVKPCILFIDEIDKKLPRTEGSRNGDSSENDDAEVAAMLQTLLDSKEMKGVFIIGAANDPGEMNEAMLRNGRFGLRVACLPPQTTKEKIKVFRAVFAQVNSLRGETMPDEIIEFIVNSEKLSGASGADYYELIRRTAIKWRTKKSTQTLGATLIECLEKFTFRINERTKIMTEKAIEMHTADFDLFEPHDTNPDPQIDTLNKLEAAIIAANERATRYEDLILNSQQALDALKLELQANADNDRRIHQSEHKTKLDALAKGQKDLEKAQKALEKKEAEIDKTIAQKTDQALAAERAQLAQEREILSKAEKALKKREDQIDKTIAQKADQSVAAERAELLKEKANLAKERKKFEADKRKLAEKEARLETIISERAAAIVAPERTLIAQERAQIAQEIEVRRSKIETENQEFIDGPVKDLYKKYKPTIPWQVIRSSLMVHPGKISALKAMIKRGGNPRFTSADHNQFEIIGGPFQVRTIDERSNTPSTFSSYRWMVEEAMAAAEHMGEISLVTWDRDRTSDLRAQIKAANLDSLNLVEDITYENAEERVPQSMSIPGPFTYIDTGDRKYLFVNSHQANSPYGWIGAINVPCHFGFENEEDKDTEKLSKIMEGLKKRGVRAERQQEKTQEANWQAVEIALKKAPLLLASVYNMENLGLNPQVFAINPNNFSIAGAVIIPKPLKNTIKDLFVYMVENGIPPMTRDRYNEEYGPIRISEFDSGWLNDLHPKAFSYYDGLITGEILIPGYIRKK